MADNLASDLNKFSNQIEKLIGVYYNLLNEDKNEKYFSLKKNECGKWCKQILGLLNYYYKNTEKAAKVVLDKIKTIETFYETIKKSKNQCIEFYIIMHTCQLFFEIYFDKKLSFKTNAEHNEKHMSRWIAKEIINLRNEISHNENPSLEFILRFYQDQFFYLKYIKPKNVSFTLDKYALEDIKLNIQIYLAKSIESENSFDLKKNKENHIEKEKNNILMNEENKQKVKKSIMSLFYDYPLKLPEFKFKYADENNQNLKNEKENDKSENEEGEESEKENNENEKNENDDINNVSQDEIEGLSITHNESESDESIDEFKDETINICEETQNSINMTKSNDTYCDYQKNS